MPKKLTSNERARIAARREAKRNGYEYRPTTAEKSREAERLNAGLEMLEDDGADYADED